MHLALDGSQGVNLTAGSENPGVGLPSTGAPESVRYSGAGTGELCGVGYRRPTETACGEEVAEARRAPRQRVRRGGPGA